ncbi:hypothetical protein Dimus_029951 [Dionaea muscipula]
MAGQRSPELGLLDRASSSLSSLYSPHLNVLVCFHCHCFVVGVIGDHLRVPFSLGVLLVTVVFFFSGYSSHGSAAHSDMNVVTILVGNKSDLKDAREVTTAEGKSVAEVQGLFFNHRNLTLGFIQRSCSISDSGQGDLQYLEP